MAEMATCHINRKSHAHGLCKSCYEQERKRQKNKKATCHPQKPEVARGLCSSCYYRSLRASNPDRYNTYAKEWREHNKDRVRKTQLEYYYRNREARIAYRKMWTDKNPERNSDTYKTWYELNKDKKRTSHRAWSLLNQPKIRAYSSKRRAKRKSSGESSTSIEREWRAVLFGNQCAYCGEEYNELDHVIAIAQGGGDYAGNLVPACRHCNRSKNNKEWREWYRRQKFYDFKREKFICDNIW